MQTTTTVATSASSSSRRRLGCSVIFGKNVTAAVPGSAQGLYLIVSDLAAARAELLGRGVAISEVFHDANGVYAGPDEPYLFGRRGQCPDPSIAATVHSLVPGSRRQWVAVAGGHDAAARSHRPAATSFGSARDLASALRRAEAAHGEHEKRLGKRDENWPDWYAQYIAAEQAGRNCRRKPGQPHPYRPAPHVRERLC